jgi:hypothetical protein
MEPTHRGFDHKFQDSCFVGCLQLDRDPYRQATVQLTHLHCRSTR